MSVSTTLKFLFLCYLLEAFKRMNTVIVNLTVLSSEVGPELRSCDQNQGAVPQTLSVSWAALSYCYWRDFEQELPDLATIQGNK